MYVPLIICEYHNAELSQEKALILRYGKRCSCRRFVPSSVSTAGCRPCTFNAARDDASPALNNVVSWRLWAKCVLRVCGRGTPMTSIWNLTFKPCNWEQLASNVRSFIVTDWSDQADQQQRLAKAHSRLAVNNKFWDESR